MQKKIMLVTNVRKNEKINRFSAGRKYFFHYDKCYAAEPNWGTMLYALEVTRVGGHTLFANMYDAWETLSDELKEKIYGRRVLQIYKYLPTETRRSCRRDR